jgi:hypothetical protein
MAVVRSGPAMCGQCQRRMRDDTTCFCGCISRSIDSKTRCSECAAANTVCDLGGDDARQFQEEMVVNDLVRICEMGYQFEKLLTVAGEYCQFLDGEVKPC